MIAGKWLGRMLGALAMAVLPVGESLACCSCDPPGAAAIAGTATTAAVNAFTAVALTEQTIALTLALQGHAAQVSANIRGLITAQGLLTEAKSNQDTQRLVQSDRIEAMKAHQFSTPLCQAATGADISIALAADAQADQVLASRANAHRTGGYRRPESSVLPVTAGQAAFMERQGLFCDQNDPACRGKVGTRPEADRMPGAVLAMGRLENADDEAQAAWLVQNLTMPVPVPALTARDVASAGGQEAYIKRGGYEAQLNLAKDVVTDTFRTRRLKKADPTFYNQLAAEAGLPQATGAVSQEDMDRMRYFLRFNDRYTTKIAGLGDPTVALREVAALQADHLQQGQRTNELLEKGNVLLASLLSSLVEGKLVVTSGTLK